jgi:hypothetical protein
MPLAWAASLPPLRDQIKPSPDAAGGFRGLFMFSEVLKARRSRFLFADFGVKDQNPMKSFIDLIGLNAESIYSLIKRVKRRFLPEE